MRKYNEGYTLVLVMVVLIVMVLLATAILTASEKNLRAQVNSVTDMQNKYQAQGEIEKVIGSLEALVGQEKANILPNELGSANCQVAIDAGQKTITIISKYDTVQIKCVVTLKCEWFVKLEDGSDGYEVYKLESVTCGAYEISSIGGGGE